MVLDLPTPEGWKAELTKTTQQCTRRESNSRSPDHESDAITTTLPSHPLVHCVYLFTGRLGKISDSLSRSIKDDVRSEISALKEAGDKEKDSQELGLTRRLNSAKKDRVLELVISRLI